MKGIVFTEFLDMVESKFGYSMADKIVSNASLESGGAYTAVGTYNHGEMVQLVGNLSDETKIEIDDLLLVYAEHFFQVLVDSYPTFFRDIKGAFEFLEGVENHIHVEVLKLYPDAELPSFEIARLSEDKLQMVYHSERRMAAFAEGLIKGTIDHYRESILIEKESLSPDQSIVKFTLTRQ